MYTIVVANFKGGVGKTTITRNLGAMLAKSGKRVLLVDTDWQSTLTTSLNVKYVLDIEPGDENCIIAEVSLSDMFDRSECVPVNVSNDLDLLANERSFKTKSTEIASRVKREYILTKLLSKVSANYDYCVIDSSPADDIVHTNTFMAADGIIIPIQCAKSSFDGLLKIIEKINEVVVDGEHPLELLGVLINQFDARRKTAQSTLEKIKTHNIPIFEAKIPDKQIFKTKEEENKDVLKELGYEFGKLVDEVLSKTKQ